MQIPGRRWCHGRACSLICWSTVHRALAGKLKDSHGGDHHCCWTRVFGDAALSTPVAPDCNVQDEVKVVVKWPRLGTAVGRIRVPDELKVVLSINPHRDARRCPGQRVHLVGLVCQVDLHLCGFVVF